MNGVGGLDKEIAELKGFIAELKAERAAQKEKEKREAWTKYTSISLVLIAVVASLAAQWAGKYSSRVLASLNDSTFYQAQASDQWSFYQAKSIKRNLYEALHELGLKEQAGADTPAEAINAKISRYKADEAKIQEEARHFEKQRDAARTTAADSSAHGAGMAAAISIFQIAVALGSICLVSKKPMLWYLSLALAVLATGKMIYVWLT